MTNDKKEKVINNLNGLLEKNYDAEQGFTSAFNATNSLELKSFFDKQVRQRISFGKNIKNEINMLGGIPNRGGSIAGSMHRAWMDLKTAVASNDEEAVLTCCHNGEKAMLEDYNDVLKMQQLPVTTHDCIQHQRNAILESMREIKQYENVYA